MSARRTRAYILMVIVAIIWGVAGSVIKFTERGIAPLPFLTYRFLISTGLALGFFLTTKNKKIASWGDFFQLVLYGLLAITFGLGALFWGLEHTKVLEMNLVTATAPLVTTFLGARILREHVTKRERLGLLIAMAGTLVTIVDPIKGLNGSELHIFGNILVFSYVVFSAISAVISKKLIRKGYSGTFITQVSFVVAFLTIGGYAIYKLGANQIISTVQTLPLQYHLGVWFMAVISGTLAYSLANTAQKTIEVGEASTFSYLMPVFGIPTAVIWLGERITANQVLGGILIATGVIIAEIKKRHKKAK